MENKKNNSEDILLELLKQQKFNFTLIELNSILSPELKEKLFGRIGLVSEKMDFFEKVKSWNFQNLKYFEGDSNAR